MMRVRTFFFSSLFRMMRSFFFSSLFWMMRSFFLSSLFRMVRSFFLNSLFWMMRSFFFSNLLWMVRSFFNNLFNRMMWCWFWLGWVLCITFLWGSCWLLNYYFYLLSFLITFIFLDLGLLHNKTWYSIDFILEETFDILFNFSKVLACLITHSCDLIVNFFLEMSENLVDSANFHIDFSVNFFISLDNSTKPLVLNIFHFGQLLLHDSHSSFNINISIFRLLLISSILSKMNELVLFGSFIKACESRF